MDATPPAGLPFTWPGERPHVLGAQSRHGDPYGSERAQAKSPNHLYVFRSGFGMTIFVR
jgi:hypothetical protein